jgi:hypothetical protein
LQAQIATTREKKGIEIAINSRIGIDIQLDGIHIIIITNAHVEGIIMNLIIVDTGSHAINGKDTIENILRDIGEENIIVIKEVT